MEFTYTNRGPEPWNIVRTNLIVLRWENDTLVFERHYGDKKVESPITSVFEGDEINPKNVAKMIHWGCCGWSAGGHQIWQLIDKITPFIQKVSC